MTENNAAEQTVQAAYDQKSKKDEIAVVTAACTNVDVRPDISRESHEDDCTHLGEVGKPLSNPAVDYMSVVPYAAGARITHPGYEDESTRDALAYPSCESTRRRGRHVSWGRVWVANAAQVNFTKFCTAVPRVG